jgi:LytR cell envelope-related transcriptional attenuator
MTDFISELEAELVAAARRRAAAPQRRRARVRLPRLRPAPVAAAAGIAAIAAAAVLVVASIDADRPGDERAVPPSTTGPQLILPAASPVVNCELRDQQAATGGVPDPLLSVFARKRVAADALPSIPGHWFPATTIHPGESRRVGDLWLVPADGIRADGACVPPAQHRDGSGLCLMASRTDVVVRCFDDATIAAGRAVALTGPDRVDGIAPDGVKHLKLEWSGGAADADVTDNVYEARTPGLKEGDAVRVVVQRPSQGCVPSRELLAAFPALGLAPEREQPPELADVLEGLGARDGWTRWARLAVADEDLELWVAPNMPCDNDRQRAEEACVVAVRPGEVPRRICLRPDDTPLWMFLHGDGGLAFVGLAPGGTGEVIVSRARMAPERVRVHGGVFGGVLPEYLGATGEGIEVTIPSDPPDVAILNATHEKRLAARIGGLLPGEELIANFPEQRERSSVLFADDEARHDAEEVARRLRITDVRLTPPDTPAFAEGIRVIVVVGADMPGS